MKKLNLGQKINIALCTVLSIAMAATVCHYWLQLNAPISSVVAGCLFYLCGIGSIGVCIHDVLSDKRAR